MKGFFYEGGGQETDVFALCENLELELISKQATLDTLKEQLKADEKAAYDLRCYLDEAAEYFGISTALWPAEKVKRIKAMKDDVEAMMVKICATITGHCPRELCTTAEAVEWLVDRHKAATAANLKLDEIRTEKLAAKGLSAEASAVSAARVILRKSKRIADESADGKPDGQEENA